MFKARNSLNKIILVGRSNNVGVWGKISHLPEVNGVKNFTAFFFLKKR